MRSLLTMLIGVAFLAACRSEATAPDWTLSEAWRVGGDVDGPHSFDANRGLGLQPGGGVVHLDWKAKRLYYLDAQGQPIRTAGREGNGPGEFRMPTGLVVLPDGSVIVRDLQNGFVHFSADGEFLEVKHPPTPFFPTGGAWNATALRDGRLLEVLRLNPSQNRGRELVRLLWDAALAVSSELPEGCGAEGAGPPATIPLRGADGRPLSQWPVLFAAPWTAAVYTADGMVWEPVPSDSPDLVKHALTDCTPVATATLSGQRAPIGAAEREIIASNLAAEAKRWQVETPPIENLPEHQSWYRTMTIDAGGNLWVERVIGPDAEARVEVYSPEGELIGRLTRELPALAVISGEQVIGFESDGDGVRYLVSYRIVKGE